MNTKSLLVTFGVAFLLVSIASASSPTTPEEMAGVSGEHFAFQAETKRLMQLLINALYTNKDIFLRELVSNGSDALEKLRFLALTHPELLGEGEDSRLEITIKADKDAGVLRIRDKGIGMTKEELIKNLGTIAQSGTLEFLKRNATAPSKSESDEDGAPAAGNDLIGQFGVGFYSAFLVADRVTVVSKSNSDDQYIWESDATGSFTVAKDPRGNTLGRGTEIILHMKDSEKNYLEEAKLKDVVGRYSQFITFPINLWASRQEEYEVEVPADEQEKPEEEEEEQEVLGEKEEEEGAEDKPATKTKKETRTVWGWEVVNSAKPIWTRSPKKVSQEEYVEFYKAITKDTEEPLAHVHFKAEGDHEFRALLYIPKTLKYDNLYDPKSEEAKNSIKLYVKRVFVTADFFNLMPPYLRFIKGVVDSDDLPINIGREQVQESGALEAIKTKVVRKSIAMIQELLKEDPERVGKYKDFYEEYGIALKYGITDDPHNRERLSKLLVFASTEKTNTSLSEYVERMKKGQSGIYYIAGDSLEKLRASPLIERLTSKGYEVLLCKDAVDEWALSSLAKYDGKELINVAKDGLKVDGLDAEKEKKATEELSKLTTWIQQQLSDPQYRLVKVTVSTKLTRTPAAVTSSQWGPTANMERVMKAHATTKARDAFPNRILEINPGHPLIKELQQRTEAGEDSAELKSVVRVMYYTAMLNSGWALDKEVPEYSETVFAMLSHTLGIDPKSEINPVSFDVDEKPAEEAKQELQE